MTGHAWTEYWDITTGGKLRSCLHLWHFVLTWPVAIQGEGTGGISKPKGQKLTEMTALCHDYQCHKVANTWKSSCAIEAMKTVDMDFAVINRQIKESFPLWRYIQDSRYSCREWQLILLPRIVWSCWSGQITSLLTGREIFVFWTGWHLIQDAMAFCKYYISRCCPSNLKMHQECIEYQINQGDPIWVISTCLTLWPQPKYRVPEMG